MAPRLKVFAWSDGFHVFTVAAGSRPKALAAWGVKQDLFATGLAHEAADSPDAEAARATPGQVIERRRPLDLPEGEPRQARPKKTPSAADRRRVAQAQAALDDLDAAHQQAVEAIDVARRDLDARREAEATTYRSARSKALARLDQARRRLEP